MAVFAITKRSC